MIRAYAGQLLGTPYEFGSYHTAIRDGPIDYYQMGNDYVGTLIDYERSVLGNKAAWDQVQAQVQAGENVVLLANHQSEADAAFIPLLTMDSHPGASRATERREARLCGRGNVTRAGLAYAGERLLSEGSTEVGGDGAHRAG
jgi:hypothetical protein